MKKQFLNTLVSLLVGAAVLVSCKKSTNPEDNSGGTPEAKGKYVLLTAEWAIKDGSGYYAAYDKMLTGNIDNISGHSLQSRNYGGFRAYKNWLFNRQKTSGEVGIVRYSIASSGKFEETGFIKCGSSAQHLVLNETTGFYFDADRGKTKIQKFNPSTMERTGEIDLSAAIEKGEGISTNVFIGNQTLIAKEGKLYANITYSRKDGSGQNDNTRNYRLVVVDIASERIDKTIVHPLAKNHGYAVSEYPAWTKGSDGALYLLTTGWNTNEEKIFQAEKSFIFRIKAGESDFDKSWELSPTDLGMPEGALLWSFRELKGKLYVDCSKDKIIVPALTNLNTNIYKFFEVDIQSKNAREITGAPMTVFGLSTGNIEVVDEQVLLRVVNRTAGLNGYYKLDRTNLTAATAFNVSRGGEASGFVRLADK